MSTTVKIVCPTEGTVEVFNQSRTIVFKGKMPEDIKKFIGNRDSIFALANVDKQGKINVLRAVKARKW